MFSAVKEKLKPYYPYFILSLFAVPLFFIGIHTQQSWGDDYAQYIKEAENIADGLPYSQSNYIYNDLNTDYAPPSYPPGFPLLLAPVIKLFGLSIPAMLYLISLVFTGSLFVFYGFLKKHMSSPIAVCLAILGVYCGGMMALKSYVLSDIPLVLFVSWYLWLRQSEIISMSRLLSIVLVLCMTVLIRSQGIILLFAEVFLVVSESTKALSKKQFNFTFLSQSASLKIIIGFVLLYELLVSTIFHTTNSSGDFYKNLFHYPENTLVTTLVFNSAYLLNLCESIFQYNTPGLFWEYSMKIIDYSALGLAIIGLYFRLRKNLGINELYFLFMCILILILPVHQGLRYFLPVLPVFLVFIYEGLKVLTPAIVKKQAVKLAVLFVGFYLVLCFSNFQEYGYDKNWTASNKEDSLAFLYLKNKVKDDEILVFSKPRALTLYTNKRCMNYAWQTSVQKNKEKFDSLKVNYLLAREGLDEHFILNYLKEIPFAKDSVKIGKLYTLYTIR